MNSAHDLGGSHGMGPIAPEADEPFLHHPWEGRVLACQIAMNAWGAWTLDRVRWFRERVPGPRYLTSSYYEIWLEALEGLIAETGLIGSPDASDTGDGRKTPALAPEVVVPTMLKGRSARRTEAETEARFAVGDRVTVRNLHPSGHTRMPRYARGRTGQVEALRGVFVFPDRNAATGQEHPHMVYSVRFTARDLWGPDAPHPRDTVNLDLWDAYLDPA